VVVGSVKVDGREISSANDIALAPEASRLEISYAPVLLHSQEGVRFRYKLEGFDKEWSEASSDRVAHYTNLPAGHYNFRAAAFETSDPNAVSVVTLRVVKRPHFYETWWFGAGCLLTIAVLVFAVHRLHVAQLRNRFGAVLEERGRLAREMHDTVIQGCTGVSAVLEAASSLKPSQSGLKQDLIDCARAQIRNTVNEAREAVWNLRNRDNSRESIEPLLQRMTARLSHESGVRVEYNARGKPFSLDQSTTHEIMMVTREAVCNAVLHANPSKVRMNVAFGEDVLTLEVIDDGQGFDMAGTQSAGHYGLIGMRERVQRMGGIFSLSSRPGDGTELTIHVPKKQGRSAL